MAPVADFFLVAARTGDDRFPRHQHLPGSRLRDRRERRLAGDEDGLSGVAHQPAPFRRRPGRRRPPDRCRGPGFPDRDGRAGRRPAGHLGLRRRVGAGGTRRRRRLRRDPERLRAHRSTSSRGSRSCWPTPPPGSPPPGSCTCTRPAARTPARPFSAEAAMAKLTATDMAMAGDHGHGPGARRRRLRRGPSAGAVHAGGEGAADRRGHQSDPADGHRPIAEDPRGPAG